MDVGCTLDVG